MSRRNLLAIFPLLALLTAVHAYAADPFPSKPVRIITPGPPGGVTDGTLRTLAVELTRMWGQPVIIDNRPGAGGLIALKATLAAVPDGHVLGFQVSGFMTTLPMLHGTKYGPLASTPISFLAEYPLVMVTSAKSPFSNWTEFADWMRKTGQHATYGTTGVGGSPHLTGEQMKRKTHFDLLSIPYKGDSPMITDAIGGQLTFALPIIGSALPLIRSGQLKPLAVTSSARAPFAPEIPTLKEQGMDLVTAPWNYMYGPPNMDPALTARIARDIAAALATRQMKEFYETSAMIWYDMSREQLLAKIKSHTESTQALIKELKIPLN